MVRKQKKGEGEAESTEYEHSCDQQILGTIIQTLREITVYILPEKEDLH